MRSHLSPSPRAIYAASVANLPSRMQARLSTKFGIETPLTLEQAAKAVGVAKSGVIAAQRVIREGAR